MLFMFVISVVDNMNFMQPQVSLRTTLFMVTSSQNLLNSYFKNIIVRLLIKKGLLAYLRSSLISRMEASSFLKYLKH